MIFSQMLRRYREQGKKTKEKEENVLQVRDIQNRFGVDWMNKKYHGGKEGHGVRQTLFKEEKNQEATGDMHSNLQKMERQGIVAKETIQQSEAGHHQWFIINTLQSGAAPETAAQEKTGNIFDGVHQWVSGNLRRVIQDKLVSD